MQVGIGYDTTISNKGTVQDAFQELSSDIREIQHMNATIRHITYPSNMSAPQLEQLRKLAPAGTEFRAGPPVKAFADGTEEYLFKQTIAFQGGPTISTLDM